MHGGGGAGDRGAGAPAAYYLQPALDGSRPGTYFANTYQADQRGRATYEAVAFHGAVPGHHFQLTRAQGLTDLPMVRRLGGFTAYSEGWGRYAERLADEMGLYSDELYRLGMVSEDSMRAARLVVDTGLHAKGWSRQQAVDYLVANTATPLVEIEAEVDRYISAPGHALAYMVGRLEIQRIRQEAERALGTGSTSGPSTTPCSARAPSPASLTGMSLVTADRILLSLDRDFIVDATR